MKKWLGVPFAALALTACDPDKTPIAGTRVAVVDYASSLKVDPEAQGLPIKLPLAKTHSEWSQMGGGADHAMPNAPFKGGLAPLWTASIGAGNGEGRFLSPPAAAGGAVYALDTEGTVTALSEATGERLWKTNITPEDKDSSIIGGGIAFGDGKVFVTSPHAEVLALDAKTGQTLWRFKTSSPVRAAPTLADGRLYVLSISNKLDVLDTAKGTPLWNHAGITEHAGLLGTASPAVSKDVVIVTYSSGEIYALKATNGQQLWTETLSATRRPDSLSSLSHIKALPVMVNNSVIIIGNNHKMATYNVLRGERLWERHIGGTRTPAVMNDFIFMVNSHNELVCLTRQYGQVVWVKKLAPHPEKPSSVAWTGPLLAGGKLYLVGTQGTLLVINPTNGTVVTSRQFGAPLSLPPLIANGTLYILTDAGDLMAFRGGS